jgi:capsular polysaccharide biosynthesis protein
MEEEISLVELFGMLKKHIGLIINCMLVGVLVASIYTFFIATNQNKENIRLKRGRNDVKKSKRSKLFDSGKSHSI